MNSLRTPTALRHDALSETYGTGPAATTAGPVPLCRAVDLLVVLFRDVDAGNAVKVRERRPSIERERSWRVDAVKRAVDVWWAESVRVETPDTDQPRALTCVRRVESTPCPGV